MAIFNMVEYCVEEYSGSLYPVEVHMKGYAYALCIMESCVLSIQVWKYHIVDCAFFIMKLSPAIELTKCSDILGLKFYCKKLKHIF